MSLHRILRMIYGGDGKDATHSDSRSVRRTLPCGRHGSGGPRTAAGAGAARSNLRELRQTTIHQATPLLATRRDDGGGRHADPFFGSLRLSRHETAVGCLLDRPLRQAQPLGVGDLAILGPRNGGRRGRGYRRHPRRRKGDPAGAGSLLPRRQPFGVHRTSCGRTPHDPRRAVAGAIAGAAGRAAGSDRRPGSRARTAIPRSGRSCRNCSSESARES